MAVFTASADDKPASRVAAALGTTARRIAAAAAYVTRPHKAAISNLLHVPFTAAGAACIDYAGFHLGAGWGWLITGVSLIVVEHIIADER